MKLWIWKWTPEGYNSCKANTREEAMEKARAMGKLRSGKVLIVDEDSLHEGTYAELTKIDRAYAGCFD